RRKVMSAPHALQVAMGRSFGYGCLPQNGSLTIYRVALASRLALLFRVTHKWRLAPLYRVSQGFRLSKQIPLRRLGLGRMRVHPAPLRPAIRQLALAHADRRFHRPPLVGFSDLLPPIRILDHRIASRTGDLDLIRILFGTLPVRVRD